MSPLFLQTLMAPYPKDEGLILELRTLPRDRYSHHPAPKPFAISEKGILRACEYADEAKDDWDVYMGVLPRADRWASGRGGEDYHVRHAAFLWVDVDAGNASPATMIAWLQELFARFPKPQIGVWSGSGGVHLYFPLAEVRALSTDTDRANFSRLLKRIVAGVGTGPDGIHADRACVNPSRILRLPGSFNRKHDPPKPVQCIIWDDADTCADWSFLPLPAQDKPRPQFAAERIKSGYGDAFDPTRGMVSPGLRAWAERPYPEGNRHHDLSGAARWLARDVDGLPEPVARDLLTAKAAVSVGARPITDREVDAMWEWASR